MLSGIAAAFAASPDITGGLIVGMQRHRDEADGIAMLRQVAPFRDQILGVGLGGLEVGNPPAKFARAFAEARALGWHTVAHAGEEGPAAYVREAVELLHVERIDHGVRAEDDPDLLRLLADRRIPLTVCPLSNVMLRVFPDIADHNLARLLRAGLCVTINSDDPPYFGGYLNDNLAQTSAALGLTEDEQFTLLANGFEAAFISPEQRASYLVALHQARAAA